MESNTELNPSLPKETRDAIRAELLESKALDLDWRAALKDRQAIHPSCSDSGSEALRGDARIFRDEARSKREKAARLRAGGAK